MKTKQIFQIRKNFKIAENIFCMVISGDISFDIIPGQFLNIKVEGVFLRRPISVCDINFKKKEITLIYKIFGEGTRKLSLMNPGDFLDILCGLGNGFDLNVLKSNDKVILISGGVGLPPIYFLMKILNKNSKLLNKPKILAGFRNLSQAFYVEKILKFNNSYIVSEDGSVGDYKGYVTDVLKKIEYDYYFVCGPKPMLKAVFDMGKNGQISMEEKMACGFGACMGCCVKTNKKMKRLCLEGPVLKSEEVIFD